jgi:hypothetical protein
MEQTEEETLSVRTRKERHPVARRQKGEETLNPRPDRTPESRNKERRDLRRMGFDPASNRVCVMNIFISAILNLVFRLYKYWIQALLMYIQYVQKVCKFIKHWAIFFI